MIIPWPPPIEPPKSSRKLRKVRDWTKPRCDHGALIVSEEERTVHCEKCKVQLDPIQALLVLCQSVWWKEKAEQDKLEYEEKRVSKVQYAAIAHLYEAGVTPEKYAERWAKEDARVKEKQAAQAKIEQQETDAPIYKPDTKNSA
jgi:hypothetical protein